MELVYPNEKKLFRIALILAVIFWILIIVGTLGIALIYIGFIALFMILAQSGFITHVQGNGVRITEEQYPDLYQRLKTCCDKIGMDEIPETYLLRTDFFNALATRFLRRHYIVLFTDVVDALQERPDAVNFYIGHELGHIHRKHIRWGWVLSPVLWLPVLGTALRRAEEYTCDRYGNACCETDEDAVAALSAIVAGDTRWQSINVPAYLKQVEATGGFFMSFNELTAEYPWLCKRMAWVMALRKGSEPTLPRRSFWAGLLSAFVPSIPGGAVSALFVVAMLGILAAVALPAYQEYMETVALAQQGLLDESVVTEPVSQKLDYWVHATPDNLTAVMQELAPIRDKVESGYQETQSFAGDLTEIGWTASVLTSEYGGMPVAVYEGGVIGVTMGEADGETAYFVNEPSLSDTGEVRWYCYGQNIANEQLPAQCQSEE